MLDARGQVMTDDRACPLGFIAVATFASGLVWLYALLSNLNIQ